MNSCQGTANCYQLVHHNQNLEQTRTCGLSLSKIKSKWALNEVEQWQLEWYCLSSSNETAMTKTYASPARKYLWKVF